MNIQFVGKSLWVMQNNNGTQVPITTTTMADTTTTTQVPIATTTMAPMKSTAANANNSGEHVVKLNILPISFMIMICSFILHAE